MERPENTPFCNECGASLLERNVKETELRPVGGVTWMNREETTGAPDELSWSGVADNIFGRISTWMNREKNGRGSLEWISLPPLSLKLTIPDGGRDVEVPLTKEVTIGRLDPASASFPDVDLTTDDALDRGVSRRHAKITRRGHEVFIEDLGSINGTFVNRKKLTPYLPEVLRNGDQLHLGELMLRVSFTQ
jgi:hypothetical protein